MFPRADGLCNFEFSDPSTDTLAVTHNSSLASFPPCLRRRVRVTELSFSDDGSGGLTHVHSWLRRDGGGSVAEATRTSEMVLWSAE